MSRSYPDGEFPGWSITNAQDANDVRRIYAELLPVKIADVARPGRKTGGTGRGLLCCLFLTVRLFGGELIVYPAAPALAASAHYQVRVRPVGGEWQGAFAWETACKTVEKKTDAASKP